MNYNVLRIISLCAVLAAQAPAAVYFVSTNGNDTTGDGTPSAPYATFTKAHAMLAAGDDIMALPGVYYGQRLNITKSGTAANPIVVACTGGLAVIDLEWEDEPCALVYGKHVVIEGFELRNSSNMCARLHGESNVLRRCVAHHCVSHGISTSGTNNVIEGCDVYMTVLENAAREDGSGWGSGVKVAFGGKNTLIVSNTIYHNYGEGICVTRGMGAVVRYNTSFDNFSVLLYIDNSYDVLVEKNFCYSLQNPGFTRDGRAAAGIALGEEQYSGWGAQLRGVRVINNVVCFADRGFIYYGSDVSGGGMSNVVVAYNTFWGSSNTAVSIEYEGAKLGGSVIANNLVQQPDGKVAWIDDRYVGKSGLRLFNNFWVGGRPDDWRNCNGPNDRTGTVAFVTTPVVTDAFSFMIMEGSAPCDGATNIFGVEDDYAGTVRPIAPAPHDMGAFQAVPEPAALLAGVWWLAARRRRDSAARNGACYNARAAR